MDCFERDNGVRRCCGDSLSDHRMIGRVGTAASESSAPVPGNCTRTSPACIERYALPAGEIVAARRRWRWTRGVVGGLETGHLCGLLFVGDVQFTLSRTQ